MLPPAYSALPSRNLPSLPHRARVAVYVVMNIEHFTFGKLGTAIQPHLTSSPEIANYGWRDYGNRLVGAGPRLEQLHRPQRPGP